MKKIHLLILSLLTGVLLSAGWPEHGFAGFLLIGLVPILFVEDHIYRNREQYSKYALLYYSFPAFLTFNGLTTWWIYNSTGIGAVLAIVLNSLFMAIVFQAAYWSGKKFKQEWVRHVIVVFYWMSFEYLHLNWSLNWPWLNLGNGFSSSPTWVQWYEYTGAFGGTLWIWLSNLFLFRLGFLMILDRRLRNETGNISLRRRYHLQFLLLSSVLIILLPVMISMIIFNTYEEKGRPVKVVIIQPNFDPYSEQYELPPTEVTGKILGLAAPLTDSTTNFLIAPESAIQEYIPENEMDQSPSINLLKTFLQKYPNLNIIIGASTNYVFKEGEKRTTTARKFTNADIYYDPFNTAILINQTGEFQLYHKSKLTPGVESLPTIWGWNFLEKFAIDLGGTVGSIGTDKVRKVYHTLNSVNVSPAICYESIFGEFFSEFVRNGAEVMLIITNDGWWGNSPGHRQHFAFARLRAIETRRDIARSANTGISAIIDQRGIARDVTGYWVPAAFKDTVYARTDLTFYTRHGDYLAFFATLMTGLFFLISLISSVKNKFLRKRTGNG